MRGKAYSVLRASARALRRAARWLDRTATSHRHGQNGARRPSNPPPLPDDDDWQPIRPRRPDERERTA